MTITCCAEKEGHKLDHKLEKSSISTPTLEWAAHDSAHWLLVKPWRRHLTSMGLGNAPYGEGSVRLPKRGALFHEFHAAVLGMEIERHIGAKPDKNHGAYAWRDRDVRMFLKMTEAQMIENGYSFLVKNGWLDQDRKLIESKIYSSP